MLSVAKKNNEITSDDFYRANPARPTCIDAIEKSKIGIFSSSGDFVLNQNEEQIKKSYLKLNEFTTSECLPDNEILGVVNYGSPMALFYSDANSTSIEINRYNMDLYRYIKNNNMFLLTVNFADDPIGFPLYKNLSAEQIENLYNVGFNDDGRGFIYSKSDIKSPSTCIGAHESYWKYTRKFAKAVVKAYADGYKNFYSDL